MKMSQTTRTEKLEVLQENAMKKESRKWYTADDRMVNDEDVPKSSSAPLQKIQGDNVIVQVHPKNPLTLFPGD